MKHTKLLILATFLIVNCQLSVVNSQNVRTVENFDLNWKFSLGDAQNAQNPAFDDSRWRSLRLPHDWSIEGDYDSLAVTKRGGGYLPAGIGWYRKSFALTKKDAGKRIFVEFGAVMANSDVWINGHLLGHRPFGYLPLLYDMTDYLHLDGKPNVVAVRADNTPQPASRWYTGAGIYRHVNLIKVNPVHLQRYGVFIHTPEVSADKASVTVQTSLENLSGKDQTVTVQTVMTSPAGKRIVLEPEKAVSKKGEILNLEKTVTVSTPELWDTDAPNIYSAYTTVSIDGKVIDDQTNTFGIRDAHFEAETGFWLNGKNIRLFGACIHHDGGAVGSAVPAAVWERRFARLKEIGCNAVRGAHSPMDAAFYELCDKMGLIVMDETFDTWTSAKPNGEKAYNLYFNEWWEMDCSQQILRVRNYPSIVIYSLGNEIRDNLNSDEGRARFHNLKNTTKKLDPTRPITMALFQAQRFGLYENGFSELLDVIGQNYAEQWLVAVRNGRPERKIIGTENTPSRSAWLVMRDTPAMSGEFIWTGFEYLGEADFPQISWNKSLFDRNAGYKTTSWERQSWWDAKPMAHIVRSDDTGRGLTDDWTTSSDTVKKVNVTVYSNCDEVELFLNGRSLGKQPTPADDAPNIWKTEYEKGTVKVIGYNAGKEVASHQHKTAGKASKILLETEKTELRADWDEVVYITATVADKDGIRNPNGIEKIKFNIEGQGEIVSVDNSDPFSHERYKADSRTVYKGRAIAIVRATAPNAVIKVTATSEGLQSGEVAIKTVE